MPKRKRSDEPVLRLLLPEGTGEPLEADAAAIKVFSTCAQGLPSDAEDWDLTHFSIEGGPITRSTVISWLNAVYQQVHEEDFEEQEVEDGGVNSLCRLLAFADAVGSTKGLFRAVVSEKRLDGLCVAVQLGQQQVQLSMDGRGYYKPTSNPTAIWEARLKSKNELVQGQTQEEVEALADAIAVQLEQLLYLAYKLQLMPLVDKARAFMWGCSFCANSMFRYGEMHKRVVNSIFSERTLDAVALSSSVHSKDEWIHNFMGLRCSFVEGPLGSCLLKPINLTKEQMEPIKFDAVLQRDLLGSPKGTTVKVRLDLFTTGQLTVDLQPLRLELRLGRAY